MHFSQAILLFFAAGIAGTLNAIAGGGSFISFPALLFMRVPAVEANATSTVALWPGLAASTIAYLKRLNAPPRLLIPLLVTSIAGGFAGALLLLKTPQRTFLHVIPWLLLGGTLLFTFGSRVRAITGRTAVIDDLREISWRVITMTSIVELLVSGSSVNAPLVAAVVTFILAGAVLWAQCAVMIAGALIGGWFGAHYVQRVDSEKVRGVVIAIGIVITVYFFVALR